MSNNYSLFVRLTLCLFQMSDGTSLGDSGSVLDFMSMKNYPDMSLEMSMLNSIGDFAFNSNNSYTVKPVKWHLCNHTVGM